MKVSEDQVEAHKSPLAFEDDDNDNDDDDDVSVNDFSASLPLHRNIVVLQNSPLTPKSQWP